MAFLYFIIKMMDAPSIDYNSKKTDKKKKKEELPKKQKLGFGTPINSLPKNVQNQIRK